MSRNAAASLRILCCCDIISELIIVTGGSIPIGDCTINVGRDNSRPGVSGEYSIGLCLSADVDCMCLPSESESQIARTLEISLAITNDYIENRGLLVAQALLHKQCAGQVPW